MYTLYTHWITTNSDSDNYSYLYWGNDFYGEGYFKHNNYHVYIKGGWGYPENSYIQSCVYAHGCYDVIK